MSLLGPLGLGIAVVTVVLVVGFYLWVARRNRREGTPGLVTRSRLTCPKCHQTFDYDYLPGASFTAVRLGPNRYMPCPLCHQWSTFNLSKTRGTPAPESPHAP